MGTDSPKVRVFSCLGPEQLEALSLIGRGSVAFHTDIVGSSHV